MAKPHQPARHEGAKTGVKPGETPATPGPVEEEDVFGGAERAQKGEPISSPNAKP